MFPDECPKTLMRIMRNYFALLLLVAIVAVGCGKEPVVFSVSFVPSPLASLSMGSLTPSLSSSLSTASGTESLSLSPTAPPISASGTLVSGSISSIMPSEVVGDVSV